MNERLISVVGCKFLFLVFFKILFINLVVCFYGRGFGGFLRYDVEFIKWNGKYWWKWINYIYIWFVN